MNALEWTQLTLIGFGLIFGLFYTKKGFFVRISCYKNCCMRNKHLRPTHWFLKDDGKDDLLHIKKIYPNDNGDIEEANVYNKTQLKLIHDSYEKLRVYDEKIEIKIINGKNIPRANRKTKFDDDDFKILITTFRNSQLNNKIPNNLEEYVNGIKKKIADAHKQMRNQRIEYYYEILSEVFLHSNDNTKWLQYFLSIFKTYKHILDKRLDSDKQTNNKINRENEQNYYRLEKDLIEKGYLQKVIK